MIEKLSEYKITSRDGSFINVDCNTKIINTLVQKINELVDAVNVLIEENNIHEKQIDELQMEVNKKVNNENIDNNKSLSGLGRADVHHANRHSRAGA